MNPNGRHVFRKHNVINAAVRASKFALNRSRFVESLWSLEPNEHNKSEKVHTFSKYIIRNYALLSWSWCVSFSNSSLTSVVLIVGRMQSRALLYNSLCLDSVTSLPHVWFSNYSNCLHMHANISLRYLSACATLCQYVRNAITVCVCVCVHLRVVCCLLAALVLVQQYMKASKYRHYYYISLKVR